MLLSNELQIGRNPFEVSRTVNPLIRPEFPPAIDYLLAENSSRRVLIHAPPRSGGTTAAFYIAKEIKKNKGPQTAIVQIMFSDPNNLESEFKQELQAANYQMGKPAVIIFDEIEGAETTIGISRKESINFLNQKVRENPNFYLIVINRTDPAENPNLQNFLAEEFSDPQQTITLGHVPDDQLRRFFQDKIPTASPEVIDWLVAQSGGNLTLAQRLGYEMFDLILKNPRVSVADLAIETSRFLPAFCQSFLAVYRYLSNNNLANVAVFYQSGLPRETATLFWQQANQG